MIFNDSGLKLIKEFEGCSLVAYQDQGGVWSIGYGCTHNVTPGMTISNAQADERLQQDLERTEMRVKSLLINDTLNANQFSALVCFAFNVGCGNLSKSTLLNCINTYHTDDAANEFDKWDKVNGIPNDGLLRRRKAEKALFCTPC